MHMHAPLDIISPTLVFSLDIAGADILFLCICGIHCHVIIDIYILPPSRNISPNPPYTRTKEALYLRKY